MRKRHKKKKEIREESKDYHIERQLSKVKVYYGLRKLKNISNTNPFTAEAILLKIMDSVLVTPKL